MTEQPRPEHPRPHLRRPHWLNLNGNWEFEFDRGDSGLERGLVDRSLQGNIVVPFAPESEASGIGDTDFLTAVWYRRTVVVPSEWGGSEVLLHFGAVDHDATVWIDGVEVARHRGGFTGFSVELGPERAGREVTIVVRARDTRSEPQARGKQATRFENSECYYTRTTGIWQTVWLEAVPHTRIGRPKVTPRVSSSTFDVVVPLVNPRAGLTVRAELRDEQGAVDVAAALTGTELAPSLTLHVPADRVKLWGPGAPHLYDLSFSLLDGDEVVDRVESYAGLRAIAIDGTRVLINGEPVFQRLVLDQGLWADTLMTAPSDQALIDDILLGQAAGFNGARLHQKVFEERYLYHADRLGYLVWGEFPDWGAIDRSRTPETHQQPTASFATQWLEAIERDYNHPSIIGWCPLNETHEALHDRITQLDDVTHAMYLATKLADPTRPVIDTSGYSHRVRGADIYDGHDYEQDPILFAANHTGLAEGRPFVNVRHDRTLSIPYTGQPYFVSEFGGIWWNPAAAGQAQDPGRGSSWGYGQRVADEAAWYDRFEGLTAALLDDPLMFGYCYTQLTDTFQEENGLYDAARRPKFDISRIARMQARPAAYES